MSTPPPKRARSQEASSDFEKHVQIASKELLKKELGIDLFYQLQGLVEHENKNTRTTSIKNYLLKHREKEKLQPMVEAITKSQALATAYANKHSKETPPDGALLKERRKDLSLPTKQYKGCLATKIKPSDYYYCANHYADANKKYETYNSLVPNNWIREKELIKAKNRNDAAKEAALAWGKRVPTLRELPNGIRKYIEAYPDEFETHLQQIELEKQYLEAIREGVRKQDYDKQLSAWQGLKVLSGVDAMAVEE